MWVTLYLFLCCTIFNTACIQGRESFIVNGEEADEGAWPWQGSLRYISSDSHFCGCVYVHSMHALTAGHCIGSTSIKAVFGTNDHPYSGSKRQPAETEIDAILVHPGFENGCTNDCYPNDIAILTFVDEVPPSDVIQPISLDTGTDRTDQLCFITGFGDLYGNGPRPERLMQAQVDALTDEESLYYLYNLDYLYNNEWHLGTFDPEGEDATDPVGLCNGDSGGPMVCSPDGGSTWELTGLASWMIVSVDGTPCLSSYASVYTRVATYREWVCNNSEIC